MNQNLLLITVDSLRADHLSSYGYERETTPNLDRFAEGGHQFTSAFSHACATRPAFPGILASSHSLMYGGFERMSEERTLIAEVLSEAGYKTAGFHSNQYLGADFGYGRGFDHFFESQEDPSITTRLRGWLKSTFNTSGFLYESLQWLYDHVEREAGVNIGAYHAPAEEMTDRAIEWLQSDGENPSFLWVHYMDPHHPYIPPEGHQPFSDVDRREGVRLRPRMLEDPASITNEELQVLIDLYDDEIHYTDREIGRLLSHAEEEWDDWTTVITADHGEEFKDHGEFSHQNRFYDEMMHVPFIVYDGQSEGTHSEVVAHSDIAPTLAKLGGVETLPDVFWGHALEPLLNNQPEKWSREGVRGSWCDLPECTRRLAYRTNQWKYIRDYVFDTEELYDLETDPNEQDNLVRQEGEPPAIIESFREIIDQYEDDIASTDVETEDVEMDEQVKERLRRLGYKE